MAKKKTRDADHGRQSGGRWSRVEMGRIRRQEVFFFLLGAFLEEVLHFFSLSSAYQEFQRRREGKREGHEATNELTEMTERWQRAKRKGRKIKNKKDEAY